MTRVMQASFEDAEACREALANPSAEAEAKCRETWKAVKAAMADQRGEA